ncbi:AbrB/MazE/SpoVT family DNA-binding domain-containing protein [Companilactobacillus mishanensis]|uniref:AbrB family transcriptional regulator n=1 Tax=Companilactobacillus mishanensis TaxID=2486008 RepID=A0A5P0ZKF4_9LACO|nr:AbrB/MazE/SpoVT family DNA-binding domain-containing protein [Companilactobacillus mishanensis]MQS45792.1 AbrB family transcriptional regulator [Companilactobacillus mishanensis]MQS53157.1 AbrB family transcriptional regulator [Companilactobacillus mishanensis]MQS90105.1 AbrB family transcriptional regulator [Companilactobacillus mishanensis]
MSNNKKNSQKFNKKDSTVNRDCQSFESKVTQKSKIKIPKEIRKALNIKPGNSVWFEMDKHNEVRVRKVPTAEDWAELIRDFPTENVKFDENGHYDPKASPNFDEWMKNG